MILAVPPTISSAVQGAAVLDRQVTAGQTEGLVIAHARRPRRHIAGSICFLSRCHPFDGAAATGRHAYSGDRVKCGAIAMPVWAARTLVYSEHPARLSAQHRKISDDENGFCRRHPLVGGLMMIQKVKSASR
jgi:hypothetical protein